MKKLFFTVLVVMLLLIPVFGFTAATDQPVNKSLTFQWEQPDTDLTSITGWSLYMSSVTGSGYVKIVDIPYVAGSGPTFTTATVLNVTGAPGTTVNRYFVLTANGIGGVFSVYSNEASYGFAIPYTVPVAPFHLIIKVTVAP